ncbi:DUF433 domain-containing protein [Agromyces sp. NPDC058484]|uniref:DUF433 domain-containing protein n=1 Tax=Agromyces sp. NPDC058484 TaxID=3346524 RepID=UPI0036632D66
MSAPRIEREYLTPVYSQSDVAQIIRATRSTVQRWTTGYHEGHSWKEPLISGVPRGRGYTVPFIGLAEGFVLNAFRKAGLPMQRIRPAVEVIKREIGLEYALASNRLVHDGAEILFRSDDPLDHRLTVVRNGQAVFNEVVADYLSNIDFGEVGYAAAIRLPQYPDLDVMVRPTLNGGRPTLARRGIAVEDLLDRVRAGEAPGDVASDYGITHDEVMYLNRLAA